MKPETRLALKSCGLIIPHLAPISLNGAEFRWLSSEAWDDEQKSSFVTLTQHARSPFFHGPAYVNPRRRDPAQVVGRWLLLAQNAPAPVAGVEAWYWPGQFTQGHLVLSDCHLENGWQCSVGQEALAMMIGATFLATGVDLIRLLPLSGGTGTQVSRLYLGGEPRPILTTTSDTLGLSQPARTAAHLVAAEPFWATPLGQVQAKNLAWLDKRVAAEVERRKPPKPRRPSVLQRINRLLRWS